MNRLGAFAVMLVSVATMGTLVAPAAHAQPILTLNTISVSYPDPNSFGGRVRMEIQPSTRSPITNLCSPVDPQGVVVELTLSAGTTFVSATLPGTPGTGVFNATTNTISWDFGTVDRFDGCSREERRAEVIFDVNPSVAGGTILVATAMVSTTTPGDDLSDNQQVVMFQGGMLPLQVVFDDVRSECDVSGGPSKDVDTGSLTSCSGGSTGFLNATASAVVGATGPPGPLGEISVASLGPVKAPKMTVSASADGDFSCNSELSFCFPISNSAEALINMDIDVLNPNPFPVPFRFRFDAYAHASCGDDAAGFESSAFIEDSGAFADCGSSFDQTGSSEFHIDADGGTGICRRHGFFNNVSFEPFDEEFSCGFFTVPPAGSRTVSLGWGSGDAGGSSTVFTGVVFNEPVLIRTGYGQYNAATQFRFGLGGGTTTFSYTAAMHIVVHSPVAALLTDDQGRRVGFDANVPDPPILTSDDFPFPIDVIVDLGERTLAEIPGGRYSGIGSEPQEITAGLPEPGMYTLDLIGTGTGPFTVDITTEDSDGNVLSQESFGGDASPGVTTSQTITLAEDGTVTLDGMEPEPIPGDLDGDGDVDRDDLGIILAARNTPASGPGDPRDLDGDGMITGLDARKLVLLCTRDRCATE